MWMEDLLLNFWQIFMYVPFVDKGGGGEKLTSQLVNE